ncbi:MAG: hypothetical protein ACREJ2_03140 [Planctomycetota bacterium]
MLLETFAKWGMGVLLFATIPVGGDAAQWGNWGLAGLVVGYTLWRDWQRERRMSTAMEHHQAWVQTTLIGALERNTVALNRLCGRRSGHGAARASAFDLATVPGPLHEDKR